MKTFLKIALVFMALTITSCNNKKQTVASKTSETTVNQEEGKITLITPEELKKQAENQLLVDVRTPEEYDEGHIENAKNINYFDDDFIEQMSKFDKSKPIIVYCRSGRRSSSAAEKLLKSGFKQIYDLKGGIINWTNQNNKTVK